MQKIAHNLSATQTIHDLYDPAVKNQAVYSTHLGTLFEGNCLDILPSIHSRSVDTVFADPPFNLSKQYGPKVNDKLPDSEYLSWSRQWIDECIRVLKPGGSLFIYNLPKWNMMLGSYITESGMLFRHWISVNIKLSLPIPGRLYPSHYSLLYFTKGKPRVFKKIRTPIETCRHCGKELKDYGGHRGAMNPRGVNLTDVWNDITPVRHWRFKSRKRKTNQLSTKILERVIHVSTQQFDVVLDPFGGSGTTFDVCEQTERRWLGIELESCDVIIPRRVIYHFHSRLQELYKVNWLNFQRRCQSKKCPQRRTLLASLKKTNVRSVKTAFHSQFFLRHFLFFSYLLQTLAKRFFKYFHILICGVSLHIK